jgi:hypothetical protein
MQAITFADPLPQDVIDSINRDSGWYVPSPGNTCTNSGTQTVSNADVFVLGDSYAEGLQSDGLAKSLSDKGYGTTTFDASRGRSITGAGSDNSQTSGMDALTADKAQLAASGTIFIVLGTNPQDYSTTIPPFAKELRTIAPTARIYWLNTGNLDTPSSVQTSTNAAIAQNSSTYSYSVIDWGALFLKDPTKYFTPGGGQQSLHPNATGWNAMRDLVVSSLGAPGASVSQASSTSSITYRIPATHGKTGSEQPINAQGVVANGNGRVSFYKYAALGQAYRDYYMNMRWTFANWNWYGNDQVVDKKQLAWFTAGSKPVLVLVTNQRTGKSIIAAALDTGPGPSVGTAYRAQYGAGAPAPSWWQGFLSQDPPNYDGLVAGMPPTALDALGARTGYYGEKNPDDLIYQWAPDQNATPGPTNQTATSTVSSSGCSGGAAGANGWDITGANAMTIYEQFDPKYASLPFGTGTIAQCGCGPTSMAMAIATLTGDKSVTPPVVADYYAAHGGVDSSGCGSNWAWTVFSKKWPIKITDIGTDLQQAITTVKSGGLVLVSYEGPPFTTSADSSGNLPGHLFLMRAVTSDGKILIANPLGHFAGAVWADQNTTPWDQSYFSTQTNSKGGDLKHMWSITKQ